MITYDSDEIKSHEQQIVESIKKGKVFVYPTDTIYGIGCNATLSKSVQKIRELKGRPSNPFSVIAPSIEWIMQNCEINEDAKEWLKKLPGPYTLIMKLKNKDCIAKEVNAGIETVGVRIPNHWIARLVSKSNFPFVTTSVNKSGEDFMTCIEDINDSIKNEVDFILYEGKIQGKPSKIVDLTGNFKIIERN